MKRKEKKKKKKILDEITNVYFSGKLTIAGLSAGPSELLYTRHQNVKCFNIRFAVLFIILIMATLHFLRKQHFFWPQNISGDSQD